MLKFGLFLLAGSIGMAAAGGLVNPGFEQASATAGWQINTYGAEPKLELDSIIRHEGKTALRIESSVPSDTALAQEVILSPGKWHRFSAWVRTQQLDPHGSPITGTVQVQKPGGAGLIASGASQRGTTEWTNVAAYFEAPPDGRVRLCLFYAGFGRGTGTVWFDETGVEEIDPHSPIRITAAPLVNARINPMQYGQFVEYLCDLVPSMWAEKLYDGSFEGLSPYKFAFIRQTDFKEKPWYPSGAVNRGKYTLDPEAKISGSVSQRIEVTGAEPCTLGISQDGIFVEAGEWYELKCWLRANGIKSPVQARLHGDGQTDAEAKFTVGPEWKKFIARLRPKRRNTDETLSIEFRGPGTLWIDNASLMPVKTVGGWRPDVVQAVRGLKPRIIRFGGSALDEPGFGEFQWTDTIGDPDRRKPFRAWGGLQPTGPGLEEFVQFCAAVDAEPMICVRFSNRKPADAAEQVEYFNGSTSTKMGALRAQNGHAKPYGIRYWQVGNERQSREYEDGLADFCRAMKAVDPQIRLLSSFPTAGSIRNASEYLDYVAPHHYTPDLMECERDLSSIRGLLRENAPGRAIKAAVTEWNTTAGDWGVGRAKLMTLANALSCSRYHNLLHRNCDLVEIANRSNLINSFGSGIIQVDNHRLYKTPTYYAQWLYATYAGEQALRIDSLLPAGVGVDLSATLNSPGKEVVIFAVNSSRAGVKRLLDLSAFGSRIRKVEVLTLEDRDKAGEADIRNDFEDPERISVRSSSFSARSSMVTFSFPPLALTVLRCRIGSGD